MGIRRRGRGEGCRSSPPPQRRSSLVILRSPPQSLYHLFQYTTQHPHCHAPSNPTHNPQHTIRITLSVNTAPLQIPHTQHATITLTPYHSLPLLQHLITFMPTPLPALNPKKKTKRALDAALQNFTEQQPKSEAKRDLYHWQLLDRRPLHIVRQQLCETCDRLNDVVMQCSFAEVEPVCHSPETFLVGHQPQGGQHPVFDGSISMRHQVLTKYLEQSKIRICQLRLSAENTQQLSNRLFIGVVALLHNCNAKPASRWRQQPIDRQFTKVYSAEYL